MGLEVIAFGRWIEEEMRKVVGNGTLHAVGEISDGGLDSRGNISRGIVHGSRSEFETETENFEFIVGDVFARHVNNCSFLL